VALRPWIKWVLAGVLAIAIIFVSAIGAGLWFLSSRSTPDVTIGETLPGIQLTNLDGTTFDLESFAGRVVVLDFWASW
jgi:cytochrome oxidase Cu insertion factor (SCO1/SenC/PrrC family)